MNLKEKLASGKSLFGPFLVLDHPAVIEIAGLAGFDFAIIDTEHGEMSFGRAVDMVRAAKVAGVSSVIRVFSNKPELIAKALDTGADAVQVPQVGTKAEAVAAVKAAKFSPLGERGVNRYTHAANYSATEKFTYFEKANQEKAVIIQVEGQEGAKNLAEIITVPGIDVLFVGPYDLSASLGIPGQVDHPLLLAEVRKIMELVRQAGVALGFFVDDVETALKWKKVGVQYISFSADVAVLYQAFSEQVKAFNE